MIFPNYKLFFECKSIVLLVCEMKGSWKIFGHQTIFALTKSLIYPNFVGGKNESDTGH